MNRQVTSYLFDAFGRVLSESSPDTGVVSVLYNDSSDQVTVSRLLSGSTSKSTVLTYDGIGRPTQTQLTSDPQGGDIVDKQYDGRDRVVAESNPYRMSTAPTNAGTTFQYDGLNRLLAQTNPDSTTSSSSYASFPCVMSTDEDTKQRQACSDALGRLRTVAEDPTGLNYETNYSYDAEGNLVKVEQGTLASRVFTYDGLSRLIAAFNPESGGVSYAYVDRSASPCSGDPSVPCSKTDARGVVATYAYDALNRIVMRQHSDRTPTDCYQYDTAVNGVGRLSAEWTQPWASAGAQAPGCSSSSGYLTMRVYGAYDAMGRVVAEQQCVGGIGGGSGYCTSAAAPSAPAPNCSTLTGGNGLQYCYDLAGNLLAYANGVTTAAAGGYPQMALSFSQTFDSAGRLASLSSSWNDGTHPQALFSQPAYNAASALTQWLLGPNLSTARGYDSRMRLCSQLSSAQTQAIAPVCGP